MLSGVEFITPDGRKRSTFPQLHKDLNKIATNVAFGDADALLLVMGAERSGKSTLAINLCQFLAQQMSELLNEPPERFYSVGNIAFDIHDYAAIVERMRREGTQRYSIIQVDEPVLLSRSTLSRENRDMVKYLMQIGGENRIVVMCVPSIIEADRYLMHRPAMGFITTKQVCMDEEDGAIKEIRVLRRALALQPRFLTHLISDVKGKRVHIDLNDDTGAVLADVAPYVSYMFNFSKRGVEHIVSAYATLKRQHLGGVDEQLVERYASEWNAGMIAKEVVRTLATTYHITPEMDVLKEVKAYLGGVDKVEYDVALEVVDHIARSIATRGHMPMKDSEDDGERTSHMEGWV